MSYMKAINEIKKGDFKNTYLLTGTESYFIEQFKKELIKSLGTKVESEIHEYDLTETSIQEVITNAETLPLFSENKLIFAYNPTFLKAKADKLPFIHNIFKLEEYLSNPASYSYIVFIAEYEKIDGRKKISKIFNKQSNVIDCSPIKEYEIRKWINAIAKKNSIQFTPEAIELIEAELSTNLALLENEIEKIALYTGKQSEVSKETVLKLLSVSTTQTALELVNVVLNRNLSEAIPISKDLEKNNEEPIALLALLAFQFRIILQVKLLQGSGLRESELQKQIKAHPYVIKLASQRARRFSIERLENIMNEITETDAKIKSGRMDKAIAFELLIYKMIKG